MKLNEQKIALRVDASSQIGTGHFMRCLTLADALKQRGAQIRFVSRHLPEYLRNRLADNGYEFVLLNSVQNNMALDELAHAFWLGVSQAQDAEDSIQALSDENWDWLIVDHYALDSRWESMLRQTASKILAIDDLADRRHDCDLLLNQNLYADINSRYSGKVSSQCQLLLGPRYALLRDEFRQLHEQIKPRGEPVKRVLVFFGGIDADNYTGRAIEALAQIDISDIHVDVVIGAQHPSREQIETGCAKRGFICHVQTDKMAELMAKADLSIGAGGIATWERCCLGLPTLVFFTADNQQKQVLDAAQEGLLYSPEIVDNLSDTIQKHVDALIGNGQLRLFISRNCMEAVDGRGVSRVIKEMSGIDVAGRLDIRRGDAEDALIVWPWRNNETTRRHFFDPTPVSLETHLAWWARSLSDPNRVLLLGKFDDQKFGVIRYDFTKHAQATISIYLDPEMTGQGLGQKLLRAGQDWLRQNHQEIETVIAEITPQNVASKRAFLAAGFKEQYTALSWKRN